MNFDVIIVNYCSYGPLETCLSSLFQHNATEIANVVVVDNSPKGVPPEIKAAFPGVLFHENFSNLGFARAVNQALAVSKAGYICLLNPDTEVKGPFLNHFLDFFEREPAASVAGPLVLNSDGSVQGSARSFPRLATAFFGRTTLLSRLFPGNPLTSKEILSGSHVSGPLEVDWVSGACMGVRRQAIDEVGGLDERFFLYWEDCDWCTRFRRHGWGVFYLPGAGPVVHHAGLASRQVRWLSNYHFHRSAWLLYKKYDNSPAGFLSAVALAGAIVRWSFLSFKLLRR